jgi:hypothetical protein
MCVPKDPIKAIVYRKKQSDIHKNKHPSEETRKKMSDKKKISPVRYWKNKHLSEEHKKKISENHKGKPPWNKGKTGIYSKETLKLMRDKKTGVILSEETRKKMSIKRASQKRDPHTKETKQKMSIAQKKRLADPINHPACDVDYYLKYGHLKSFEPYCELFNNDFRYRVRVFFNFTCCLCGCKEDGRKHSVHHIHYNKSSCCDPIAQRKFVLLCTSCHSITTRKESRDYWTQYFEEYLALTYGNKCYFTKKEIQAITNYIY